MKKLIVYCAGKWAEKLLTIERYKEVAYFIETDPCDRKNTDFFGGAYSKPVYSPDILDHEDHDDVIIIISDNLKFAEAKEILISKGFTENIHFFNGWKLDFSFYKRYFGDSSWNNFEEADSNGVDQKSYRVRTGIMSSMIPADVTSVMDIGCGVCTLKSYLSPEIIYYGLDCTEREGAEFVCDINKEPLPDVRVDLYYLAGLVYYVDDLDKFISQLKKAKYILFDYGGTERYLRLDGVPDDPLINARNNFVSTDDLFRILRKNRFTYEDGLWDCQKGKIGWHFYLFKNMDIT